MKNLFYITEEETLEKIEEFSEEYDLREDDPEHILSEYEDEIKKQMTESYNSILDDVVSEYIHKSKMKEIERNKNKGG
jgi:hypothetical protein